MVLLIIRQGRLAKEGKMSEKDENVLKNASDLIKPLREGKEKNGCKNLTNNTSKPKIKPAGQSPMEIKMGKIEIDATFVATRNENNPRIWVIQHVADLGTDQLEDWFYCSETASLEDIKKMALAKMRQWGKPFEGLSYSKRI